MNMASFKETRESFFEFNQQLFFYIRFHARKLFSRFETVKDFLVGGLYSKRGKYVRPFLHSVMMVLLFFGIAFGPKVVAQAFPGKEKDMWEQGTGGGGDVLGVSESLYDSGIVTLESDKPRARVIEYTVREGDTLGGIAEKFGVSSESVKWANEDVDWKRIEPGDMVKVPPVTGIVYEVKSGDTIYSIAEKFKTGPQGIVDFPFNSFADDENFTLVVGQTLIVPDGVMPDATSAPGVFAKALTPDAGSVSATGSFVWPVYGRITQGFRWYHPGLDIANKSGGAILAADSGTVTAAGWVSNGYGYRVVLDHGNRYQTLYAHMSKISVVVGQSVTRGNVIGQMGSTGRSTGVHLHFEIIGSGGRQNPLGFLQ